MGPSNPEDSQSSSSADSESPSKRQKLETSASSSSNDTAELEIDRLKLEVANLEAQYATAIKELNFQKKKNELIEKEKVILEVDLQSHKVRIGQLQEDIEVSLRQNRETRNAQLLAEAKLSRLKVVVERQFDQFMEDFISDESSSALRFLDGIKKEKEIKSEGENVTSSESLQNVESQDSTPVLTSNPKKSAQEAKKPLDEIQKLVRKLKMKPALTYNIVAYVDLTEDSAQSPGTSKEKESQQIGGSEALVDSLSPQTGVILMAQNVEPDVGNLQKENEGKSQGDGKAAELGKDPNALVHI